MSTLRARRWLGLSSLAILLGGHWMLEQLLAHGLRRRALVSGLVLFGLIILLGLYNARKKLPFLPLVKASTWLQFHVYAGLFAMALFGFHVGFRLPRGALEGVLAALFMVVSLSGLVGLGLSRWLPPRLSMQPEQLIFERIPALRVAVRQEVERLVLGSVAAAQSTSIADFYERRLRAYFERPRFLWSHLVGYSRPLYGLLAEVDGLDRYLNPAERDVLTQIREFIHLKDNLDFQRTAQGVLKGWLFVHIPLSCALLLAASIHGLLAWRFS